jgi:hypothetical protein
LTFTLIGAFNSLDRFLEAGGASFALAKSLFRAVPRLSWMVAHWKGARGTGWSDHAICRVRKGCGWLSRALTKSGWREIRVR